MKRLLVNGSPRGAESNSRLLLSWLVDGMAAAGSTAAEIIDLAEVGLLAHHMELFRAADEVVLVFPLYTDSLPGLVKNFLDRLAQDRQGLAGKRIGFVVQSGFPESIHSEALAAWLGRLCQRLGFENSGIVIRGGVEGIRVMPENWSQKLKADFVALGMSLEQTGHLDQSLIAKLASPRTLGLPMRIVMTLLKPTGLMNFYWNSQLRKFNAWKKRHDRPYAIT